LFQNAAEPPGVEGGTEREVVADEVSVLGREDRFARADEGEHLLAPFVEEAVLGQRPIEEVEQVADLVGVVLQADGQSARVGFVREPGVIGDLVRVGEWEAGVLVVAFDVIRLDCVEAFSAAQVQPRAHDRSQQVDAADVQPFLAGPAGVVVTEHLSRGIGLRRSASFPTSLR